MKHGKVISLLLMLMGVGGLMTLVFGEMLPGNPLQFASTTITTTTVIGNTILGPVYGPLYVLFVTLIAIPIFVRYSGR